MGEAKLKEALNNGTALGTPHEGGPAPHPTVNALTAEQHAKIEEGRQIQQMAHFSQEPAIFINGVYVMVVENFVRFNLHETLAMTIPTRVRFSGITTPETMRKIGEAFIQIADGIKQQAEEAQLKAMGGQKPEGAASLLDD